MEDYDFVNNHDNVTLLTKIYFKLEMSALKAGSHLYHIVPELTCK